MLVGIITIVMLEAATSWPC